MVLLCQSRVLGSLTLSGSTARRAFRQLRSLSGILLTLVLLAFLHLSAQCVSAQVPDVRPQAPKTAPDEPKKQPAPKDKDQPGESGFGDQKGSPVFWYLLGSGVAAFVQLGRLVKRFYPFLGLGVVLNPWTGIFLTLAALVAPSSHMILSLTAQRFNTAGLLQLQPLQTLVAILVGNGSSALGRLLGGKRRLGIDPSGQAQDRDKLNSDNLLIAFISVRIKGRMNQEIDRMAQRYDWDLIKTTVSRLLQNERALDPSKEVEEVEKFVQAFEPSSDTKTDQDNKYRALQRVVGVSSFTELRSRLAQSATKAS